MNVFSSDRSNMSLFFVSYYTFDVDLMHFVVGLHLELFKKGSTSYVISIQKSYSRRSLKSTLVYNNSIDLHKYYLSIFSFLVLIRWLLCSIICGRGRPFVSGRNRDKIPASRAIPPNSTSGNSRLYLSCNLCLSINIAISGIYILYLIYNLMLSYLILSLFNFFGILTFYKIALFQYIYFFLDVPCTFMYELRYNNNNNDIWCKNNEYIFHRQVEHEFVVVVIFIPYKLCTMLGDVLNTYICMSSLFNFLKLKKQ